MFSDSLPGTKEAIFGVGFERDVSHRDFACNAVYYDPINDVLVDPTGRGIGDAESKILSLICRSGDPYQHAQIFIRAIKFVARGFTLTAETESVLSSQLALAVPSMRRQIRIRYMRAQVLGKCASAAEHHHALQLFRECMERMGLRAVWDQHFEPIMDGLLNDRSSSLDQ